VTTKRFEELPLAARARGSKLLEVLPELKDTIANIYPSEETDRRIRAQRAAREREEQEARQRARHQLCEKALSGEHGREVQRAAQAAYKQAGELSPTAVQRIVGIVQEHERAKRARGKDHKRT